MQKLLKQCPECQGEIFSDEQNGEEVCTNCGLVTNNFTITKDYIPYEEENQHYPSHNLAIGKNLGTQIAAKELWAILQHRSKENIPFRYNLMQSMLLDNRKKTLTHMLIQGSRLCQAYGLASDITFSNYYGTQIRKASSHTKKEYCNIVTKAIFIIAWSQTYHNQERTKQLMLDLGITTAILQKVTEYLSKETAKQIILKQNVAQSDDQKIC